MSRQDGGIVSWMDSAGGPLLLLSGEHLSSWGGIWPPADGRQIEAHFRFGRQDEPATDYDRACDVEGYLGLLDIGAGHGLVLGDEPMSTAWLPYPHEEGGIFIRWGFANGEAWVLEAVTRVPETAWQDEGLRLTVGDQPLYLIDAAKDAQALVEGDYLAISLPAGLYTVSTTMYKPDIHTELVLHRLRYISA